MSSDTQQPFEPPHQSLRDWIDSRKLPIKAFVAVVAIVTLMMLVSGIFELYVLTTTRTWESRMAWTNANLEFFKSIAIGGGVALAGVFIPAILSEARKNFSQLKDSRLAYSEAKTGFDYLGLRLCALPLKEAAALVQKVHTKKHMAELYDELDQHLERRAGGEDRKSAEQWGDLLYSYLYDVRRVLECRADEWDGLTPSRRLAYIREVLPEPYVQKLVKDARAPLKGPKAPPKVCDRVDWSDR